MTFSRTRGSFTMGGTSQMPTDAEGKAEARDRRQRESHDFHSTKQQNADKKSRDVDFQRSTSNTIHDADVYDRRTEHMQQWDSSRRSKTAMLQCLTVASSALYCYVVQTESAGMNVNHLALLKLVPLGFIFALCKVLGYGQSYGNRIGVGIICCAVADACRRERDSTGLLAAALAFGVAGHAAFASAFVTQVQLSLEIVVFSPPIGCAAVALHVLQPALPAQLLVPAVAYTLTFLANVVLAYSRVPEGLHPLASWRSGCAGAALLAVSDAIYAYDRFYAGTAGLPYASLAVDVTYLAGQFFLALSAHGAKARPLSKALGSVENFAMGQSFRIVDDDK